MDFIKNEAGETRVITITGAAGMSPGTNIKGAVYTEEEGHYGWFRFDFQHLNGRNKGADANYRQSDGGSYTLGWERL